MPEGDVVWYTARRLHEALAGRPLTRSDFRVPRLATADLTGDVVTETVSRGKHLLTRTLSGLTVHTHLRMDGSWRVRPAAERAADSHRIRLVLANEEWQAIGYALGVVELLRTGDEAQVTGHLGPDLLGPDWDCAEAVRRLGAEPDRPIAEALLDQANLAGIGNLYKAEVLFLRGINPWRPVGAVADLGAVAELARRLLDANKERIGQVTTGNWRRGEETWVYGRRGRPCRRCGTLIRSAGQQERVTFWCPSCQPDRSPSLCRTGSGAPALQPRATGATSAPAPVAARCPPALSLPGSGRGVSHRADISDVGLLTFMAIHPVLPAVGPGSRGRIEAGAGPSRPRRGRAFGERTDLRCCVTA